MLIKIVEENEKKSQQLLMKDIQKKQEDYLLRFLKMYKNLVAEEIEQVMQKHNLIFDKIDPVLRDMSNTRYLKILIEKFKSDYTQHEIKQIFKEFHYNYEETLNYFLSKIKPIESTSPQQTEQQNDKIEQKEDSPKKSDLFTFEYTSEMRQNSKMIFSKFNEDQEENEGYKETIKYHLLKLSPPKNQQNTLKEDKKPEKGKVTNIDISLVEDKIHAKISFYEDKYYCYVAFYALGDSNCIHFDYLLNLKNNTFIVDRPPKNGEYEFRLFNKSTLLWPYSQVCPEKKFSILIEDQDNIQVEKRENDILFSWSIHSFDPLKQDAYVAIFEETESRNNYYKDWNWLKNYNGSLTFRLPREAGIYIAKVFVRGEKGPKFVSQTIKVI